MKMEKYVIQADTAKNRLNITLNGFFSDAEVTAAVDKIIDEAKKLKPGFVVINDVSNFKPASQTAVGEMKRAQVFVKENGAARIIRVVGEATLASMQLSRSGKEAGYDADTVGSLAEVEKLLGG
jgi:hypothetical protein